MTDDERRERFAAALYEQSNPGFTWADAVRINLPDCAHWREQADAAMAVADQELTRVREELDDANGDIAKMQRDIARLRAELEKTTDEWRETALKEGAAYATISRVRAVLDEWYGTSDASALSAEIRAALDGADDASS